jgi:hypothetical protein
VDAVGSTAVLNAVLESVVKLVAAACGCAKLPKWSHLINIVANANILL